MKGQMELIEILVLIVGVLILFTISNYFVVSRYSSSSEQLIYEQEYEKTLDVVKNFFYAKIPVFEKTYAQIFGDAIVNDMEIVDYGNKYGGINSTEIVYNYFSSYFQKNWYLKIPSKNKFFGFNSQEGKKVITFILRFPLPSYNSEVIDIEFAKW